jgi:hypothetical protein
MKTPIAALFFALACFPVHATDKLTMEAAVRIAEKHVADNGYTNRTEWSVKAVLDDESLELGSSRDDQLAQRFNTLMPNAIGARPGRKKGEAGWSVAFDPVVKSEGRDVCRIVTMTPQGFDVRMEHIDGLRNRFIGFQQR